MNTLTIFRIESTITNPDDVIIGRNELDHVNVRVNEERLGDLYIRRTDREAPQWARYFTENIDLTGLSLNTASLSALLLISQDNRLYALTFGYGRTLLNDACIERRFGLRVTLNAVEPSQLRSIDHKRLDTVSRHTREQLSRAGALEQFGLDIERDLLGAVTGTPADAKHGKRLSGADQLTVVADAPLPALRASIRQYADLAEQTTYTTNFPWVDNVREVKDNRLNTALDGVLVAAVVDGTSNCWLAPPDLIEWDKPVAFAYRAAKSARQYHDLEIANYFTELGAAADMTGVRLAADKIYYSVDGEAATRSWSVSRCLIADCTYQGKKYVLNDGRWYEIEEKFANVIEDFVAQMPVSTIDLPDYADKDEGTYNLRAVKRDHNNLICLDKKLITYPPRGKIEACDIYSKAKQFVHVKRCGGSGTLSHLFSQGVVSAQLLVSDSGFRSKFQELIPAHYRWGDPNDPLLSDEFEVCYAIVARKKTKLELPFFSKVSLRAAAKNIRQLGMKVSLLEIPS